jgi:PIN domain nuclease of toxin-antitoxin system
VNAVLLDTHVILWWLEGAAHISARARSAIEDIESVVLVSAASAWEIAIKHKAGKLDVTPAFVERFAGVLEDNHFGELPISMDHAIAAGLLESSHKDPFDRMLIAQARVEGIPVVSTDRRFDDFDVRRIW